jgi:hypothetical protein
VAKLIADHRYAGPSSVFFSTAPNDVHNPAAICWAAPYTGDATFPANPPPEFKKALQGRDPSERTVLAADGTVTYSMDETSLQLLAAKNPVACAITFHHLVDNIRTNLLGWSSGRLKDNMICAVDPQKNRQKGKCYAFIYILTISYPDVIIIPNPQLIPSQTKESLAFLSATVTSLNATSVAQATYMASTMVVPRQLSFPIVRTMLNFENLFLQLWTRRLNAKCPLRIT